MNMNLTDEKIALFNSYKERTVNREIEQIKNRETELEQTKTQYQLMYLNLIRVSKDFSLKCDKKEVLVNIDLYDIDENGHEIKVLEIGDKLSYAKPKEVIEIKTYTYDFKLSYTGKVPEGHEYYVILVEQYSKWSYRKTGYKMKVQGTGICSWDKRGQMTNAKSVHKKIVDIVECAFIDIEYKNERAKKQNRIIEKCNAEFGNYGVKQVEYGNINEFEITFDNGIKITFYGYEDFEGNITFQSPKITMPHNKIDIKHLIEKISKI